VFARSSRGYDLHLGALRVPQSTYLLIAALIVGVGGGFGAVAFRALIAFATTIAGDLRHLLGPLGPFALIVTVGTGGALAAWIAARFAPEARGHGVPEVMAAVALKGGVIRPRIIIIKALASAVTIGFGGAAGREGPIVQIGSTIGSLLGQLARAPAPVVRTLVACGAAAGISATFNAPIGGVFFASEVILGDFAPRSFAVIVVASVTSAVIGRTMLGNRPSFDASGFNLVSPNELALYALLGVICAFWATGFVKLLYFCEDRADAIKLPATLKGFAGFAAVGAIGVFLPQILGVGYDAMQHVLDGHVDVARAGLLAVAKPVATSLTLAAGGSGGVFAPSLYTGAMLGDAFGRVAHLAFPTWTATAAAYGLVGMAAVFAAAAEAPITAIMIVFEMSDDYTIILPLMIATVIASILGRRLLGSTVYEMKLQRRGIDWQRVRRPHALAEQTVAGILETIDRDAVRGDEEIGAVVHRLGERDGITVADAGTIVGTVSAAALAMAAVETPHAAVATLAHPADTLLHPADSLSRAADIFADPDVVVIPIVDPDGMFAGSLRRSDVLDAYRSGATP
jgi:CIC family chloride channel protein